MNARVLIQSDADRLERLLNGGTFNNAAWKLTIEALQGAGLSARAAAMERRRIYYRHHHRQGNRASRTAASIGLD